MYRRNETKKAQKVNRQIYKEAFEPFRADFVEHLLDHKGPSVSAVEATSEIVWHNKETRKVAPTESAVTDRLLDAVLDPEEYRYGPNIIVKAFPNLDLVFFKGRLRSNVCVQWASDKYFQQWQVPPGAWGFSVRPQRGESGQCLVKLNAKTILLDPSTDTSFKTMFGTMLHEMCHAYEYVGCFPEECDQGDGHDKHFRTKIHAVHRRAQHLLGLWAIDKRESYRKGHFMSQDWFKEWRDMDGTIRGQSSKEDKVGDVRSEVQDPRLMLARGKGGRVEAECVTM